MKKILTLMAAMSACAGTAMASDFNFANPTVDAKEDGSALTYNETAKAFSFTVTAEDEITLTATGNVTVKLNGTALTAADGKYKATADGKLTIELGTSAVTKIVVVSSNSRLVQAEIEKAQVKMGEAIAAVAKYVGYGDFYNAVQAEVSKAGQKVQDVKAKLAELKEANKVTDDNREALIAELNSTVLLANGNYGAVKMAEDAIAKADATFALFNKIIGTDAKVALNALKKANGTATQGEWVVNGGEKINNTTMFTHNLKAVKNNLGIVTGTALDGFKTTWIESEWNKLNDEVNKTIKNAAIAELNKYPNAFVENDEQAFVDMYQEVVDKLHNVIARANFERDNLKTVNDLTAKVNKVDAALKAGAPFALNTDNTATGPNQSLTEIEDFNLLKEQIAMMQSEVNSSENRYGYSQDEFNNNIIPAINTASTKLDAFYTELVGKARKDLEAKLDAAQKNLTKVSYEVSAKYEHESATQIKYQKQFSEQQNSLDKVKNDVKASTFPTVQTDYKAFVDQISNINKKVDEIWVTTLSSQKAEINTHNQQAKDQIFKAIDAVRADYSLYVEKINTWINDDAIKDDYTMAAVTALKANLNTLFSIINGLDDMKAEVTEAVDKMTENIKKGSDEEFGAHYEANKNIYRLTEDKVKGYLDDTKTVSDAIYDELKEAARTANAKAYNFVMTNTKYGVKSIRWATNLIDDAMDNVKTGDKYEMMSAAAAGKFIDAYGKIAEKDLSAPKGEQGEGYVEIAKTEINRLKNYDINKADFKDNILADKVVKNKEGKRELPEKYIAPVETAVKALNLELESYKAQYKDIYDLKVEWNTAKAKEDELQAKVDAWEKANNVAAENHFNVNKELTLVNEDLANTLKNLEKGCLTAKKCEEATEKAKENYAVKMYMIQHFTEAKANEAAAPVVSAKVAEVEKAIADARTKVAEYADDIKNKANADLNTIDGNLTSLKSSIDKSVKDNTIAANKDGFIASLTKLAGDVTKVLEAAAQAAKDADLDYNGDGKVDVKDLVDADADFQNTGDGFTFYKFLDAYLEYLSK